MMEMEPALRDTGKFPAMGVKKAGYYPILEFVTCFRDVDAAGPLQTGRL